MRPITLILSLVFLGSTILLEPTWATEDPIEQLRSQSIKPAPNPAGPSFMPTESASEGHRTSSESDLRSGESYFLPHTVTYGTPLDDPGFLGQAYVDQAWIDRQNSSDFLGGATPPNPFFATTTYPFNTIYKLIMRFNVGGTDYFYNCSAWSAGDFHLVTAGHCLYNWDPNDDGDTSDRKWADDVWAFAGQTDLVNPVTCGNYCADHPYGWAKGIYMRSYTGWTISQNHDHDFAVLTLDRDMGDRTGWMGRSGVVPSAVNFSGYPTETPFVPAGINVQYYGFDSGNVVDVTDFRIELDAFIYGGHSGGPSWKFVNGSRYVVGIHSTSDRNGTAFDTLLTDTKRADINSWISTDETERPPTDQPDVTESLFDGNPHKSIDTSVIGRLDTLGVDFQILNGGFTGTGDIFIAFYASDNYFVSTSDHLLEIKTLPGINSGWATRNYSETVEIPSSLPAGDYTIGWLMSTPNEYLGDIDCGSGAPCSNLVSIFGDTLTVEDCNLDAYESDDQAPQATLLSAGQDQDHSICATGDEDWYRLVLTNPSSVTLETSGASGDTTMLLYNEFLNILIETNDDGGTGNFSRIDRVCDVDELAAGTYYVKLVGTTLIESYQMSFDADPCDLDSIFADGFESGNTSAWSAVAP